MDCRLIALAARPGWGLCPLCDPVGERLLPLGARRTCGHRPAVRAPAEAAEIPRFTGPGAWLKRLLGWIGITEEPGCGCSDRAAQMDAQGIAWCLTHCWTITGWLAEAAALRWPRLARARLACRLAALPLILAAIAAATVSAGRARFRRG